MTRVIPMRTKGGNQASNQNKVIDEEGVHFFSYGSKVASYNGLSKNLVTLYEPYWNMYSQTTNKYFLKYLRMKTPHDITSITQVRKLVENKTFSLAR